MKSAANNFKARDTKSTVGFLYGYKAFLVFWSIFLHDHYILKQKGKK